MPRCFLLVNQQPVLAFADFCLTTGRYVLGRSAECDLSINHETVSRRHAELVVTTKLIQVTDLSSRNGTFLNGDRITTGKLDHGRLQFGQVMFTLEPRNELPDEYASFDQETTEGASPHADSRQRFFLTPTQWRVLSYLRQGLSEKEVAVKLDSSQNTIHHHVQRIYRAFDVHSRAELMAKLITDQGDIDRRTES